MTTKHSGALLFAALLGLITVLAFSRTWVNGFLNYDDPRYVAENPYVAEGLSSRSVGWALRDTEGDYWHPVTSLSHVVIGHFFGTDPAAHHAANVLLHAANAALVFLLLRGLTGATWPSAFVGALFALHPLRVESVAWVTERSTVLSVFLSLLGIVAYVAYVRRKGPIAWSAYAIVLACTAMALMTKPVAVTLPFVLLLLDFWPLRHMGLSADDASPTRDAQASPAQMIVRLIIEKLPLFAIVAAVTIASVRMHADAGLFDHGGRYTLTNRFGNALVSYAQYLWMTVWPVGLSIAYPHLRPWASWQALLAGLLVAGVTLGALSQWRGRPYLVVGWLWFLGTLVPVIGVIQVRDATLADRYTYFPHIGLFIAIVWGIAESARSPRARLAWTRVAVIVLVAWIALTWRQLGYWQDSTTLFARAVELDDENWLAHHQLGNELARQDDLSGAEEQYRAALRARPDHARSHLNLGNLCARRQKYAEAEALYREAVRLKPDLAPAHLSLGHVLRLQGRLEEAELSFAEAIRRNPQNALGHYQWGVALRLQDRLDEAARHFEAALAINPKLADAARELNAVRAAAATRPASRPATRPAL